MPFGKPCKASTSSIPIRRRSALDGYRRRWEDDGRRRADFHLHFPEAAYRGNLQVLVAGCGTSQAARHALRQPGSHVVGIDVSAASLGHTEALKRKHGLSNLEVARLPVERAGELGRSFDLIICTGVLHHLPDPAEGLSALRGVLAPDGAIHLMVYGTYGRAGVAMLQEYCRRLGVGASDQEIRDLALTLTALPRSHPLARLLAESPDFQRKDALADALLNPQERAFSVPQLLDLIESEGLRFGRWVRQAPYLPQCSGLAATPHAGRLAALPLKEQYAALELFRGTMLRHSLIAYRDDAPGDGGFPRFEGEDVAAVRADPPAGGGLSAGAAAGGGGRGLDQPGPRLSRPVFADRCGAAAALRGDRRRDGDRRPPGTRRRRKATAPACGSVPAGSTGSSGSTIRWSLTHPPAGEDVHDGDFTCQFRFETVNKWPCSP